MEREIRVPIPIGYRINPGKSIVELGILKLERDYDKVPKSWEEFCKNYAISSEEAAINKYSNIIIEGMSGVRDRDIYNDRNICTSKEEAEAFRALMQLRQLRKAWVDDWKPIGPQEYFNISYVMDKGFVVDKEKNGHNVMSFPFEDMAYDFLNYFSDLFEKAKILL